MLCQQAMDAKEAKEMLVLSRQHPELVSMIVPSPITFTYDATVINILKAGTLGSLVYIEVGFDKMHQNNVANCSHCWLRSLTPLALSTEEVSCKTRPIFGVVLTINPLFRSKVWADLVEPNLQRSKGAPSPGGQT